MRRMALQALQGSLRMEVLDAFQELHKALSSIILTATPSLQDRV